MSRLKGDNAVLVVVDVQGKLAQLMWRKEALFDNLQRLVKGARVLELPVVWVEQNPEGLGPTIPELTALLEGVKPVSKFSFSCCGTPAFVEALGKTGRRQVVLCGIETHVCVYQSAMDMLAMGYEVHVASDCVSSRCRDDRDIGLEKMRALGASVTGVETALFEMLGEASGDKFKAILKIVRPQRVE